MKSVNLNLDHAKSVAPEWMKVGEVALHLIKGLFELWEVGVISKYDFYSVCNDALQRRWLNYGQIVMATGIKREIVQDRIRYLRSLAE